jgi:hypothetical protein
MTQTVRKLCKSLSSRRAADITAAFFRFRIGPISLLSVASVGFVTIANICSSWAQPAPEIEISVVGPEEVVFDWDRDTCFQAGDRWIHVPDAPITAYRRSDKSVVMLSVNRRNISLAGPDASSVAK